LGYFGICVGLRLGFGHSSVVEISSTQGVCKKHHKYQEQTQFWTAVWLFLFLSCGMLHLGYACLISGLCWAIVGYVSIILGSCWAILVYFVVCVGLCWARVGTTILGLSWATFGHARGMLCLPGIFLVLRWHLNGTFGGVWVVSCWWWHGML